MRRVLLSGVLVLVLVSPSWADFESAQAAYEQGDFERAFQEFRGLAEQGHAEAQCLLGAMYAQGHSVPQDLVLAQMWFNLSAAQGDLGAQVATRRLARHMTRAEVTQAQKMARDWKAKRAESIANRSRGLTPPTSAAPPPSFSGPASDGCTSWSSPVSCVRAAPSW